VAINSHGNQQPWQSTAMAINSHGNQQPWQSTAVAINSRGNQQPWQSTAVAINSRGNKLLGCGAKRPVAACAGTGKDRNYCPNLRPSGAVAPSGAAAL